MVKVTGKGKNKGKKLLWRVHHWAGLYAGILIGVLSLTGALAVFIPEIDALILKYRYGAVSSAPAAGVPQFGKSVDSLIRRYPNYSSLAISLPEKPGKVIKVDLIIRPSSGDFERHEFFIDAGADHIIGQRDHQNSLANYLRQIHVRLYEGYWGRQLVGLGGVALAIVAVTGLLIYGNFMKRQKWPDIRKKAGLRIVMADWHKLLGISALAFNLVIALTGAWLGLQPVLMRWFDIEQPNRYTSQAVMDPEQDKALAIDWHKALPAIKASFPELEPRYIVPSSNGSGTIAVRGNVAGLVYERAINTLILSKTDYAPVFKYDVREQSFAHKLYFVQEALHFGDFGGLTLKALYALLGLTSGFLGISGFVVFLYRTDKRKERKSRPLKIVFIYSTGIVLLLTVIALISLFAGYALAARIMGWAINAGLVCLLILAIVNQIRKKSKQRKTKMVNV